MNTRYLVWVTILGFLAAACSKEEEEVTVTAAEIEEPAEEAQAPAKEEAPAEEPEQGALDAPEDVAEPPAEAEKSESGLATKVLQPGTGDAHPGPTDRVTVHYTGWTTDGKMFDSSVARGAPATFPLNQVIKGWTEGLQLMTKGEKRRLWIPAELAYGNRPGRPQGMLVFDVELIDFEKAS